MLESIRDLWTELVDVSLILSLGRWSEVKKLRLKGNSKFSYIWNEAEWHFASAENRDLFAANPKKYKPNHSGF